MNGREEKGGGEGGKGKGGNERKKKRRMNYACPIKKSKPLQIC